MGMTINKESIKKTLSEYGVSFTDALADRLVEDVVSMLTDIQLEIEELDSPLDYDFEGYYTAVGECSRIVGQKIHALKEN